jgi:hypothetical protein
MTHQNTPYPGGGSVPVHGHYVCDQCRHVSTLYQGGVFPVQCPRCVLEGREGEGPYWFLLFDAAS